MTITVKDNELHVFYESLEEFELELPTLLATHNRKAADDHVYKRGFMNSKGPSWFGTADAASAMKKIKDGWPEMHQRLTSMWGDERPALELAASTVKVRRRKRHHKDYGDVLNMQRVWSGELDRAWERPEREYRISATQRHATLYIDLGTYAGESADSVLWRSAAALLICDILITAGRAIEIYVGSFQEGAHRTGPKKFWSAVKVKSYAQPLQVEKLTAMVTMAFYRTYGFLMMEAVPYKIVAGHGAPLGIGLPLALRERQKNGELVVRISHCNSRERAEEEFMKVREMLMEEAA